MLNLCYIRLYVEKISKPTLLMLVILAFASCTPTNALPKTPESPFGIVYYHADPASHSVSYGSYYYYDFKTGQASRLTPTDQVIDGEIRSIHWSPMQHQFVYGAGRVEETGIFTSDLTGREYKRLTSTSQEGTDAYWSPDGTRIAYLFRKQIESGQLAYVMKSDGSEQHALFTDPRIVSGGVMRWAPNSHWIAVLGASLDQKPLYSGTRIINNIYIVDADNGQILYTLADGAIHLSMDWSPDGRSLAYTSNRDENLSLSIWNLDTDVHQRIENVNDATNVIWSPDGKLLALETASSQIYVIQPDGGNLTDVTTGLFHAGSKGVDMWSPDSRCLVFGAALDASSNSNAIWDVYVVDIITKMKIKITSGVEFNVADLWVSAHDPSVSCASIFQKQ